MQNVSTHINIDEILEMLEQRYIVRLKHPTENIWIYNYAQKTQYEQHWNQSTLQARGLILDEAFNVIARPIPKFFNLSEVGEENLPSVPFKIYEKLDGSLGILYWINEQPFIATRGNFSSEQAEKANEMLYGKYAESIKNLDRSKTYLFEIIYPENKIVVDYGDESKLVLIATIDTATGDEMELENIGFPLPRNFDHLGHDFDKIQAINAENEEGFVIRYENGMRVKLKFDEYVRIHRIVTMVTTKVIWEQLQLNNNLDRYIEEVPDEFYTWVKEVENELRNEFKNIENEAKQEYKVLSTERETALYFKECKHTAILFAMYRGKDYSKLIWKRIKPEFEKGFSTKEIK